MVIICKSGPLRLIMQQALICVFLHFQPLETRLISETTAVCKPEQVAKQIVKDAVVSKALCCLCVYVLFLENTDLIQTRASSFWSDLSTLSPHCPPLRLSVDSILARGCESPENISSWEACEHSRSVSPPFYL